MGTKYISLTEMRLLNNKTRLTDMQTRYNEYLRGYGNEENYRQK